MKLFIIAAFLIGIGVIAFFIVNAHNNNALTTGQVINQFGKYSGNSHITK